MADEEDKKDKPTEKDAAEVEKEIKNIHPVPASKDMEREDLTEERSGKFIICK